MAQTNGSGWFNESRRHSLASKGIETGTNVHPLDFVGTPLPKKKWKQVYVLGATNPISEREIQTIKMHLNKGDLTPQSLPTMPEGGLNLTQEQTKKGYEFLMNLWKTPAGEERKNNPFGLREQEILSNFKEFRLVDWYDAGNMNFHFYVPVYEVEGDNTSFEYYVSGGEIHIIG